jgi:hypothetical protein
MRRIVRPLIIAVLAGGALTLATAAAAVPAPAANPGALLQDPVAYVIDQLTGGLKDGGGLVLQ